MTASTPAGIDLVRDLDLSLHPGDALVIKGRSGTGKTTLLRGLAGLWLFVDGESPARRVDTVPVTDLYPADRPAHRGQLPGTAESVGDDAIRSALERVFLAHLVDRLDEEADWAAVLSPGRTATRGVRPYPAEPARVFDEATSPAIDEGLEFELYSLIRRELARHGPRLGDHRSTTDQHHQLLELTGGGAWNLRPLDPSAPVGGKHFGLGISDKTETRIRHPEGQAQDTV